MGPTSLGHTDSQPGDLDQKKGPQSSTVGGLGKQLKMEPGRNYQGTPSVCDSGGGSKVKKEAMENDQPDSLNRYGPQGAESGALTITKSPSKVQFRQPLHTEHSLSGKKHKSGAKDSGGSHSSSSGSGGGYSITKIKSELEDVVPPGISISKLPSTHDKNRHSSKDESILPLVSITPISGRDTNDQKMTNNQDSLGIEIIPLGGMSGSENHPKAKSRDLKRSLSEDDKRRIERKEKRRREEMKHRASVSPRREGESKREGESSGDKSSKKSSESKNKDPKAKLAGVIERLAHQTGDSVGLEIRPSPPKEKDKKFSGLKMTFKNKDVSSSSSRYDGSSSSKHDSSKSENKHSLPKQSQSANKLTHKVTERFITERFSSSSSANQSSTSSSNSSSSLSSTPKKVEEKKKDTDSSKKDSKGLSGSAGPEKPTVSIHIVKSPAAGSVHGNSPMHRSSTEMAEPIIEDPVLIGK